MADEPFTTAAGIPYEDTDCTPEEAVEAVKAVRATAAGPPYRIALRPDDNGDLDDVVVKDVEMFRAEMMDDGTLWMCCYLEGHDRVNFWVTAHRNKLLFTVTEQPRDVIYEDGSL